MKKDLFKKAAVTGIVGLVTGMLTVWAVRHRHAVIKEMYPRWRFKHRLPKDTKIFIIRFSDDGKPIAQFTLEFQNSIFGGDKEFVLLGVGKRGVKKGRTYSVLKNEYGKHVFLKLEPRDVVSMAG